MTHDHATKEAAIAYRKQEVSCDESIHQRDVVERAFHSGAEWRLEQVLGMLRSDDRGLIAKYFSDLLEREVKGKI